MTDTNYYDPLLQEDINVGVNTSTKRNPGGGQLTGTQVGIHTFAVGQLKTTVVYDPPSINPLGVATTTVAVSGASLGDFPNASFSLDLAGLMMTAYVSAAGIVTVKLFNPTTSIIDVASGNLMVLVFKSR